MYASQALYSSLLTILRKYNTFINGTKSIVRSARLSTLTSVSFLHSFYKLNDLVWQEGFLIDFAQKKTTDKFIRKFLILSAYLFSERYVFDKIIKFYSDLVVLFSNKKSIFEFSSVSNMLFTILFIVAGLSLLISVIIIASSHATPFFLS